MGRRASQRGSITPVFTVLFGVVLILIMAVLDREWTNYMLKLADQTADFAAEAGAAPQHREVRLRVSTIRRQYWQESREVCLAYDGNQVCTDRTYELDTFWREEPVTADRPVQVFRENWREVFGCTPGTEALAPNWACDLPYLVEDYMLFTVGSTYQADDTFRRNWQDKPRASLRELSVSHNAATRQIWVQGQLEVESLFGLFGPRRIPFGGSAAVQYQKPELK